MADKEDKILTKIADTITKLDEQVADIADVEASDAQTGKSSKVKLWFAEHKAIHEIKRILHEVGKYEKYDEKELEKTAKFFEDMSKDAN